MSARSAIVVGAGIIGLATARELAGRGMHVTVVEKEHGPAQHQTGRNSGVIHSGLYYRPGSLKARLCTQGQAAMKRYAAEKGIAHETCGKLVVATRAEQLEQLARLERRGAANGVPTHRVSPAQAREHEPYVRAVGALRVASTGIVDYPAVSRALADDLTGSGSEIRYGAAVREIGQQGERVLAVTDGEVLTADLLVGCAGLHADRLAHMGGVEPGARIVPFRGEFYELVPEREHLVNGLIYPVPDPRFPFLGVHLTRSVHGGVHVGPNAVLALAREGYRWGTVNAGDLAESLRWPGLWRLAAHNLRPGVREVLRSLSPARFAAAASELVPGIEAADLRPAPAGVRAQALRRDGSMVDDFLIAAGHRQVHVINAPSPAATGALAIAAHVATLIPGA